MKIAGNILLTLSMLFATLWINRLSPVHAQSSTSCGYSQSTCKAEAQSEYNACLATCATGSAGDSCRTGCKNQENINMGNCTQQYNQCIASNNQYCAETYCPDEFCESTTGVTSSSWDDNDQVCICQCGCPLPQPNCPTPICITGSGGSSWQCNSPIVVDVNGEGFHLTSAANGVYFDFEGNGKLEKIAWTDPQYGNAWLALDRNHNGRIDNATELFGNLTPQPPSSHPNGYLALAIYDKPENGGNGDGFIDPEDAIYSQLVLWVDSNHNGISEPDELHSLAEMHVSKISLHYTEMDKTDQYGNLFRYRAPIRDEEGRKHDRYTWDVFLQRATDSPN